MDWNWIITDTDVDKTAVEQTASVENNDVGGIDVVEDADVERITPIKDSSVEDSSGWIVPLQLTTLILLPKAHFLYESFLILIVDRDLQHTLVI